MNLGEAIQRSLVKHQVHRRPNCHMRKAKCSTVVILQEDGLLQVVPASNDGTRPSTA